MNKKQHIKGLRELGFTFQEIGNRFGITAERVRQILIEKSFCKKHQKEYIKICIKCLRENQEQKYQKNIKKIIKDNLMVEIKRLKQNNRDKELIIQKTILIKKLRNEYKLSFSKIALLLERDRTSIKNLYDKEF